MKMHYTDFLKDLKKSLDFTTDEKCERYKPFLDSQLELAEAKTDPAKASLAVWAGIRKAAADGVSFTYPDHCESSRGITGDTVDARAEAVKVYLKRIQNFVAPMSWRSDFFTENQLQEGEMPRYENTTNQAVRVAVTGQDGGFRERILVPSGEYTDVRLAMLSSERVKWKLFDLVRGKIGDEAAKLVEVARDVALDLDSKLGPYLANAIGAFNWTNVKKHLRTLNLHPDFVAANLPSTNELTGLTGAGGVNLAVVQAAFKYCERFGGVFSDGDIYPVAFYFPSALVLTPITDISVTDVPNSLNEQILNRGYIEKYLGRTMVYRPLASLGGKYVYIRTNKPVGDLFRKKAADRVIRKQDDETDEASLQAKIAYGIAVPEIQRPNLIRAQVLP